MFQHMNDTEAMDDFKDLSGVRFKMVYQALEFVKICLIDEASVFVEEYHEQFYAWKDHQLFYSSQDKLNWHVILKQAIDDNEIRSSLNTKEAMDSTSVIDWDLQAVVTVIKHAKFFHCFFLTICDALDLVVKARNLTSHNNSAILTDEKFLMVKKYVYDFLKQSAIKYNENEINNIFELELKWLKKQEAIKVMELAKKKDEEKHQKKLYGRKLTRKRKSKEVLSHQQKKNYASSKVSVVNANKSPNYCGRRNCTIFNVALKERGMTIKMQDKYKLHMLMVDMFRKVVRTEEGEYLELYDIFDENGKVIIEGVPADKRAGLIAKLYEETGQTIG